MTLRVAPLRRSLARQQTIMGAERTPVLIVMLAAAMLIVTGLTVVTTLIGTVIGLVGVLGLRKATNEHPNISRVFIQFIKYQKHYPARTTFDAPRPHADVIKRGARNG